MKIRLVALVTEQGHTVEAGGYNSPVVPRVGDIIPFSLTCMLDPLPYPGTVRFRVYRVDHPACNMARTEAWQFPYHHDTQSDEVIAGVVPDDQAAIDYIERLVAARGMICEISMDVRARD